MLVLKVRGTLAARAGSRREVADVGGGLVWKRLGDANKCARSNE